LAYTVPTSEPSVLTAGDSWWWDRYVSDYPPSDGYTLKYQFKGEASFTVTAATSSSGDYYEVREAPATHTAATAGPYRLIGYVVKSTTERWPVFDGLVELLADPSTNTGDQRTANEIVLDAIQGAISGRITRDQEEVEINGRRVKFIPITELVKLESVYINRVAAEKNGGVPRSTYVGAAF
jgi:hypothetical protein